MIINRVPELLALKFGGEDKINLSTVEQETGLTYSTVARWAKNRVERADFPVLEVWCQYFQCGVGDLLVHQVNAKK